MSTRPNTSTSYNPRTTFPRSRWMRVPRTYSALVRLARSVDDRSTATHRHSERVADVVAMMARRVGFANGRVTALHSAALVHDVGKIAIPDAILLKPGPLDVAEIAIVQHHAAAGADLARHVLSDEQVRWVRHHHERIDGSGYPDGLRGQAIPFESRLMAVADAYDAMVAHRVYRAGMTPEGVLDILEEGAGTQWCRHSVDLIRGLHDDGYLHVTRPGRRDLASAQPLTAHRPIDPPDGRRGHRGRSPGLTART